MDELDREEPAPGSLAETAPSPNDPPWNSLVAFLFWVFSVLMIMIVPIVFLLPYIGAEGFRQKDSKELENLIYGDPTAVIVALGGTFGAHAITLLVAWLIVTKLNRYSFRDTLGWKWGGFKIWHGLLIFVAVYGVAIGLNQLLGSQDNDMLKILRSSRGAVIAVAILATFSAPLVEEVVYRGILFSAFQRTFNAPVAIGAVTMIFALVHVLQYYPDAATIISILLLSLILTLIRAKTNNLLPCIFFHFIFNGFQSALLILQPLLPDAVDPTKVQSLILR
jgi:membrane protease YdiL (CAAX protease family)